MKSDPRAVTCHRCGDYFQAQRRTAKYCSHACRQAAHAGRPIPDADRTCDWCSEPLTGYRADARYCSAQCRAAANRPLSKVEAAAIADAIR